jgi:type II restriction enzyme
LNGLVKELEARYYFDPLKQKFESMAQDVGLTEAMNYLTEIMQGSIPKVGKLIQARIDEGVINDFDQASKTVAGNAFQGLVAYALVRHQQAGILSRDIEITLKPKRHRIVNEYATIKVGNDVQKPDIDLLIYSKVYTLQKPVIIYSMKTSLRERVGQTYKWKLLMDIATADDCQSIKSRYELSYHAQVNFKVGLITTNFYEEISNPQQVGMLRFFDFVYITKAGDWGERVRNFSRIVQDLSQIYR